MKIGEELTQFSFDLGIALPVRRPKSCIMFLYGVYELMQTCQILPFYQTTKFKLMFIVKDIC